MPKPGTKRGGSSPSRGEGITFTNAHEEITARIVAHLEAAVARWARPWRTTGNGAPTMPSNATTGRRHSGINVLEPLGCRPEAWLCPRPVADLRPGPGGGGCVGRGERRVVHANVLRPKDGEDHARGPTPVATRVPLRVAPRGRLTQALRGVQRRAVRRHPCRARGAATSAARGRDRPVGPGAAGRQPGRPDDRWRPSLLRPLDRPRADAAACRLPRATGLVALRPARAGALDGVRIAPRPGPREPPPQPRLRARGADREDASAFASAPVGLAQTIRHADYIGGWIEPLQEDPEAVVRAASAASKACEFMLALDAETAALDQPEQGDAEAMNNNAIAHRGRQGPRWRWNPRRRRNLGQGPARGSRRRPRAAPASHVMVRLVPPSPRAGLRRHAAGGPKRLSGAGPPASVPWKPRGRGRLTFGPRCVAGPTDGGSRAGAPMAGGVGLPAA